MYSQMLCLNNWDAFHKPAEKDCSPDVDAAETVRFSWKVVGLQGQREHESGAGSPFCVDFKATIHLTLNFAIFTIKAADMPMVYKYYEKS